MLLFIAETLPPEEQCTACPPFNIVGCQLIIAEVQVVNHKNADHHSPHQQGCGPAQGKCPGCSGSCGTSCAPQASCVPGLIRQGRYSACFPGIRCQGCCQARPARCLRQHCWSQRSAEIGVHQHIRDYIYMH